MTLYESDGGVARGVHGVRCSARTAGGSSSSGASLVSPSSGSQGTQRRPVLAARDNRQGPTRRCL